MAKPGYKGKVKIGNITIAGMAEWAVSGATRQLEDDSEFGDECQTFVPIQIVGGEVTVNGNYLLDEDAGQQLLLSKFKSGDQITDLKLYTDLTGVKYLTPDDTTTPASYVTVSKEPDMSQAKAGLAKFSVTFKVSGVLKLNTSSTQPGSETLGAIDVATTTVTLVGELTGMGGHGTLDCYFDYGLTTSYGSTTKVTPGATTMTEVGLHDAAVEGLTTETLYYFRAVVEDADTNKWYGLDKTFTTS